MCPPSNEARGRPCVVGVALAHVHLRQPALLDEAPRQLDEMTATIDAEHMAALADTLGQKMQHAAGTAAEIDDLFALFDSNAIELRFGVRAEGDDLARQPLDFGIVASEQVAVGLGHGASRVR